MLARVPIFVLTAAGPAARLPERARHVIRKPIDAERLLGILETELGAPAG